MKRSEMIEKLDRLVGGTKGVLTGEQILILTELAGMAPPAIELYPNCPPLLLGTPGIREWELEEREI